MAKKKPTKKAAAAKKKPTKRTPAAKKTARKPAAKSPRKAAAKKARKAAPKKAAPKKATGKTARKAAPKPAAKKAGKAAPRKATKKAAGKAAPKAPEPQDTESFASAPSDQTVSQAIRSLRASSFKSDESDEADEVEPPPVQFVETTSAGTQPLAPEHAAVDDLTSSGNELLDIFQKYDRNRTGYLEVPGFARLLEALGQNITDEELQMAFDDIDTERAGKISWMQFKNWWTSR